MLTKERTVVEKGTMMDNWAELISFILEEKLDKVFNEQLIVKKLSNAMTNEQNVFAFKIAYQSDSETTFGILNEIVNECFEQRFLFSKQTKFTNMDLKSITNKLGLRKIEKSLMVHPVFSDIVNHSKALEDFKTKYERKGLKVSTSIKSSHNSQDYLLIRFNY